MQRQFELVAAGALAVFALAGLLVARPLTIGTPQSPGPGFFPFYLLILLGLCGIGLIAVAVRRPSGRRDEALVFRWRKPALVLAVLLVYALLFERLGFLFATFAVIVVLLRIVERQRWLVNLGSAVLISASLYLLFHWLGVRLPPGFWSS